MRAAVMRGGRIDVEDVPDPNPGAGQLLIAPHATGICGSDLHLRRILVDRAAQSPDAPQAPIVPGHEFAGEVVAIGPNVTADLAEGDLVTAIPFTHGPTAESAFDALATEPDEIKILIEPTNERVTPRR